MKFSCLLLLFLFQGVYPKGDEDSSLDTVKIKQGTLQGIPLTSRKGRKYHGFLGVPYGKIPQRFDPPLPADKWEGVLSAKTQPPPCFQFFVFTQSMLGVENCLKLNIFAPVQKKGEKKLPVMVYFFPGGFQIGGAFSFEGNYFMDQDVILVPVNYRLGALGFLNTGEGSVSGNMGMKDQVMALEFVKQNIEAFGGDPNQITIFGNSAGAASVDYLTLSPMAKGLFQRAIAQSGSSLNPWAFQQNPTKLAKILATNAGCSEGDWPQKVKCLREKEPSAIVNAQLKLMKLGFEFDFLHMKFVPSIETEKVKGPRFLEESPYDLLKEGKIASKVPYMTGFTENEGSLYVATVMKNPKLVEKLNKEWEEMTPELFYYENSVPTALEQKKVSKKIWDFYFKNKKLGTETIKEFGRIYSERFFTNGIAKGILLHAKEHEVYPYIFDYKGQQSFNQILFGANEKDGVGHSDDLIYMFNKTFTSSEIELETEDGNFSEKFLTLLVSFAKDGKPSSTWGKEKGWEAQGKNTQIKYYKIDLENTSTLKDPFEDGRKFWESLPIQEHEKFKTNLFKDEL